MYLYLPDLINSEKDNLRLKFVENKVFPSAIFGRSTLQIKLIAFPVCL